MKNNRWAAVCFAGLSPEAIRAQEEEFLRIAEDVEGEYWALEQFLVELPEKWTLSFVAIAADAPVGYAIASRKTSDIVHLHHFMVRPAFRGRGLGSQMMDEVERRARQVGAKTLSLKFRTSDTRVERFYMRLGLRPAGSERDYSYMAKALG
jgi:ribosomal protein S18 acetylase RimI-like enzyme